MPDTFTDYKKQRFRWAYGAMQIMKAHAPALLIPARSKLTAGQRYHFVAGWLPWFADGFNLIFNLAALGWSVAMILRPGRIDAPLMIFSVLPLSLFTFKLVKLAHLYTHRVGVNLRQTFAAAIAGLALAHTIGLRDAEGPADAQRALLPHAEAGRAPGAAQRNQRRARGNADDAGAVERQRSASARCRTRSRAPTRPCGWWRC